MSFNQQPPVELAPNKDKPGVFEYFPPNGQPALRLFVEGGKVVVVAGAGAAENMACQVTFVELGRRIKWPDGAESWHRLFIIGAKK